MTNVASVSNVPINPVVGFHSSSKPNPGDSNFVDRRQAKKSDDGSPVASSQERRQFGNSYRQLSEAGRELAEAIDAYKVRQHRRYITTDEMLEVITKLGYHRD